MIAVSLYGNERVLFTDRVPETQNEWHACFDVLSARQIHAAQRLKQR